MGFDYSAILKDGLNAANRWGGFPPYNFVGGHNDADSLPVETLVEAAAAVLRREGRTLATYGLESGPMGYRPLRELVSRTLADRNGMTVDADDVLITSGSLQSLDLVNAVLVAPGDCVIVEEATYGGAVSRLKACGARVAGARLDDQGLCMDSLDRQIGELVAAGDRPKYIYTIPTVQNPTGSVLPVERRRQLLEISARHGVPIFEDDCYADLTWDGARPPAIHALDKDGRVIYCGSFSKTIAPAFRIGYVIADWQVMSRMLPKKTDAGTGALGQMVLAEYCAERFDEHCRALRGILKGKAEAMAEALSEQFGTAAEFATPRGGIFIWVSLPESVDTSRLAEVALAEGVAINPGAEWVADPQTGRHKLRLCFGNPSIPTIRDGVARLAEICHREFGVPLRGANVEREAGSSG